MISKSLKIAGLIYFEPTVFSDERGYFLETYNQKLLNDAIGDEKIFVQDNQSYSKNGVLRGLHYQSPPFQQGKLVRVVQGEIFDVAVDLRNNSDTFGEWVGLNLSSTKNDQLWIPEGFAHGFLTISDCAVIAYKCTKAYSPRHEEAIIWNDPNLRVNWPCKSQPILSSKDKAASFFSRDKSYF